MTLAVIESVRQAIQTGQALRQSEILALCATADQLWQQAVTSQTYKTSEHRREYMRLYMRNYRAKARLRALVTTPDIPDDKTPAR